MDETKHFSLLDQYGSKQITTSLSEYEQIYAKYEQAIRKLKSLNDNEQQMAQRLDLIQFQLNEISQANLQLMKMKN